MSDIRHHMKIGVGGVPKVPGKMEDKSGHVFFYPNLGIDYRIDGSYNVSKHFNEYTVIGNEEDEV
ncbi:hypothetical protein [Paenibacillus sp. Y412MC10]|uniref:hypothetical protein n=1 Tax=Geobacillus sp. (strain Y412MC10) TaxID=481743 RepID=UPI001642531E|nr:hypothetical protein [Paenibacillus sp. Y412MC10]